VAFVDELLIEIPAFQERAFDAAGVEGVEGVGDVADFDFDAAERMTHGVRLSSSEIQQTIQEYGGTLVTPGEGVLLEADVIEIGESNPRAWSVVFALWTKEEGESDLSLELTVTEELPNPKLELDGLHVR